MALIERELAIVEVQKLFTLNLKIPEYQRPYTWSVKSTNTLFHDTYSAYDNGVDEYRLGSIVLHKHNNNYYIVDGQQRLTTLSILLYCLDPLNTQDQSLFKEKYSPLSNNVIVENYRILNKRIKELSKDERQNYKEYLLNKCSVVQIVTDNEQEAFQFFDSQNSRGKALAPHDLLKSYHLREMNNEEESHKIDVINQWENINQDHLNDLFKNYLYPLTQWYKGRDGVGYAVNKIDIFKGIKSNNIYNYALYHKASNLFVEQFNHQGNNELLATSDLNQFQLTQPLIGGRRFFHYVLHYGSLLDKIQKRIVTFHHDKEIPSRRSGDIYTKQLYECSLLFFTDRFGFESLTDSVMRHLYSWSYSLRLVMNAVYPQTINKYSQGQHERINEGIDMFTQISEMNEPGELKLITLKKPETNESNLEKYQKIHSKLCDWNGW
ncbi:hypothetical protein J416_06510 [Gracilibacillus halophilus YIM-C55.5]|uniref:Uncharacterized protein n=1 Tax=Gracilibacillus halophilus YIM-C55.5 TaxID=1308866 RepID=N4WDB1_9BACI|nr:DUF262 domain-containing protein [Gracilibacillus halophilus]ENH97264.1 hypothetical protein J416_06510 [Gracilibacillus halophilus YIM-C55.5]